MENTEKPIIREIDKVEGFLAGDHTFIAEVLHPKNSDPEIPYSIAYGFLEPGKSSLDHKLKSQEVYIFLSGSGSMVIDESKFDIKTNHLVLVPKNSRQYVINEGEERLVFLCIVSPPWKEEDEEIY